MAVGQGAVVGGDSYLAIGRETTYGTGVTCTAGLDFISAGLKLTKEFKILEQIETSRTFSKGISTSKRIEGSIEFYFSPLVDAAGFLLQNAMGGTVTVATATGETIGGGALTHTFNIGSMDQTFKSLSINIRKGGSSDGKIFEYSGMRVGECTFTGEIDEALKCSVSLIGKDVTSTTNSVAGSLTVSNAPVLSFVDGRFSVEGTAGSLTASSFWHVQSVEMVINNNLNSDNEARRIGSDVLSVLPPGIAEIELKAQIRFDTTTAWAAMVAGTQLAAEFEFLGPTITGSAARQGIKFVFPKVFVKDAGDPEVGDAGGVLTSEVSFAVLRDDSSATGYALRAIMTNTKATFAS